jgi:hypothetical protein
MRSKVNLRGSLDRNIAGKLGMGPLPVPLSSMPMEWLDAGSWRLPSGKALAEFALQAGFLAPLLLKSDWSSPSRDSEAPPTIHRETLAGGRHLGKGGNS